MSEHEVTFDIYDHDTIYPGNVILRIRQDGHWGSVSLTREAALKIAASNELYHAVALDNDFLTPSDEAVKAGMNALDKAEGAPIGTRWDRYIHRRAAQAAPKEST
jgi:hypothetical protein